MHYIRPRNNDIVSFTVIIVLEEFRYAKELLLPAGEEGLTDGDYAFILFLLNHGDFLLNKGYPNSWAYFLSESNDSYRRCKFQQAFDSVLVMSLNINENNGSFKHFQRTVKQRSSEPPFYSQVYEGYIYNNSEYGLKNQSKVSNTNVSLFCPFFSNVIFKLAAFTY